MHRLQLSGFTVKAIVVGFSVFGIVVLFLIGYLSEVPRVGLSDLDEHVGEVVKARGTVLGTVHYSSGASKIMIIDGNKTAEVYVETAGDDMDIGIIFPQQFVSPTVNVDREQGYLCFQTSLPFLSRQDLLQQPLSDTI